MGSPCPRCAVSHKARSGPPGARCAAKALCFGWAWTASCSAATGLEPCSASTAPKLALEALRGREGSRRSFRAVELSCAMVPSDRVVRVPPRAGSPAGDGFTSATESCAWAIRCSCPLRSSISLPNVAACALRTRVIRTLIRKRIAPTERAPWASSSPPLPESRARMESIRASWARISAALGSGSARCSAVASCEIVRSKRSATPLRPASRATSWWSAFGATGKGSGGRRSTTCSSAPGTAAFCFWAASKSRCATRYAWRSRSYFSRARSRCWRSSASLRPCPGCPPSSRACESIAAERSMAGLCRSSRRTRASPSRPESCPSSIPTPFQDSTHAYRSSSSENCRAFLRTNERRSRMREICSFGLPSRTSVERARASASSKASAAPDQASSAGARPSASRAASKAPSRRWASAEAWVTKRWRCSTSSRLGALAKSLPRSTAGRRPC